MVPKNQGTQKDSQKNKNKLYAGLIFGTFKNLLAFWFRILQATFLDGHYSNSMSLPSQKLFQITRNVITKNDITYLTLLTECFLSWLSKQSSFPCPTLQTRLDPQIYHFPCRELRGSNLEFDDHERRMSCHSLSRVLTTSL